MINTVKDWLARARTGNVRMPGLFWFSMAECTIVPVPIEIILFPVMQMNRTHVWRIAFWVTLGALIGSLGFYAAANLAMDTLGERVITMMGWESQRAAFDALFARYGFWAILIAGILPIPLQLGMLAAGAASYPIALFALAIIASRALRYYGIAWLVLRYGNQGQHLFDNNKWLFAAYGMSFIAAMWLALGALQQFVVA